MARQPSTINLLPKDILEKLQELLRDPRVTQLAATAKINAILAQEGHPERLSKSSVNRYSLKMDEVGAKLQQSREISDMWIGKLGAQPAGKVGHLLNEIVRTLAFDAAMKMSEDDEVVDPKDLRNLSMAIRNLETAASLNVKREAEIKKRVLEEAAEAVGEAAQKHGVSQETIDEIHSIVLGI